MSTDDDTEHSPSFWRAAARRHLESAAATVEHDKIMFHLLSATDYQERAERLEADARRATHARQGT